jgi:hypothetical protein
VRTLGSPSRRATGSSSSSPIGTRFCRSHRQDRRTGGAATRYQRSTRPARKPCRLGRSRSRGALSQYRGPVTAGAQPETHDRSPHHWPHPSMRGRRRGSARTTATGSSPSNAGIALEEPPGRQTPWARRQARGYAIPRRTRRPHRRCWRSTLGIDIRWISAGVGRRTS